VRALRVDQGHGGGPPRTTEGRASAPGSSTAHRGERAPREEMRPRDPGALTRTWSSRNPGRTWAMRHERAGGGNRQGSGMREMHETRAAAKTAMAVDGRPVATPGGVMRLRAPACSLRRAVPAPGGVTLRVPGRLQESMPNDTTCVRTFTGEHAK
jgi:hypothetical protein